MTTNALALVGHCITLLGFLAGATTVAWQLGKQHKSNIQLQRENAREALKLKLHAILMRRARVVSRANVAAYSYVHGLPFTLRSSKALALEGVMPPPVREKASEFRKLHERASKQLISLIEEFESWSIAFPGLPIFQTAMHVASHDVRTTFGQLHETLLDVLPWEKLVETSDGTVEKQYFLSLSEDKLAKLTARTNRHSEAVLDLLSYVHDLTTESQNQLLSTLFDRKVPSRRPLDPRQIVISTEPKRMAELQEYFENETPWGKAKKQAEDEARLATIV